MIVCLSRTASLVLLLVIAGNVELLLFVSVRGFLPLLHKKPSLSVMLDHFGDCLVGVSDRKLIFCSSLLSFGWLILPDSSDAKEGQCFS